jgi:hypothetical protein
LYGYGNDPFDDKPDNYGDYDCDCNFRDDYERAPRLQKDSIHHTIPPKRPTNEQHMFFTISMSHHGDMMMMMITLIRTKKTTNNFRIMPRRRTLFHLRRDFVASNASMIARIGVGQSRSCQVVRLITCALWNGRNGTHEKSERWLDDCCNRRPYGALLLYTCTRKENVCIYI